MGILNGCYQGMMMGNKRCSFTILHSAFFILLLCSSNAAIAACVGTITATTPTSDFVDHGNGTVTHTKTGLMWKQCSEGLSGAGCATGAATIHTWQVALQLAETLNAGSGFAGFTDWRLPNEKELNSIVERQCRVPAINATIFPVTATGSGYWSASPATVSGTHAWGVFFVDGSVNTAIKTTNPEYVRLVRGGQ